MNFRNSRLSLSLRCHFAFLLAYVWSMAASHTLAGDLGELKVIYVGSERETEFVDFLAQHVAEVQSVERDDFDPSDTDNFDVVLLDWPQSMDVRITQTTRSPLGKREDWNRPTVLLGSAGLNLACVWRLRGGSGCTCLAPLVYGLKDHPIFDRPFTIDRDSMTTIETPSSFQDELDQQHIDVIPIFDDYQRGWRSGWCTYSTDFDAYPDVEFFCGGVNHKTPTAAAIWRQGNLLHFGFQQSPAEMNDIGDRLLLNSIAYISNFSEDRPIATTPSVFVGPRARPRATIASWLNNPDRASWVKNMVAHDLWQKIQSKGDVAAMASWAEDHTKYFTTDEDSKLMLDEDLLDVGMGFDEPTFLTRMIEMLDSDDVSTSQRASRLLYRYVPDGPKTESQMAWKAWYKENEPFLFATDYGHYRWYIDPLAKERNIPTTDLRGFERMDVNSQSPYKR